MNDAQIALRGADLAKIEHARSRENLPTDPLGSAEINVARYLSDDHFAAEQALVFQKTWQVACRSEEIGSPGEYLTFDLGRSSLLFVRDRLGGVHGFHNACTHRGCELVSGRGRSNRFVCPYHAWAFDLNGRLAAVPEQRAFETLDRETHGLKNVKVEEWAGFLWFNLDAKACSLAADLGQIHEGLDDYGLEEQRLFHNESRLVEANWKLVMDNFNESYHNPVLHGPTSTDYVDWRSATTDTIGDHTRFLVPWTYGQKPVSTQPETAIEKAYARVDDAARAAIGGINIFPNFFLYPLPAFSFTIQVKPLSSTRSEFCWSFLGYSPETDEEKRHVDDTIRFLTEVYAQDTFLLPQVQRGLQSGAIKSQPVGFYEGPMRAFHAALDRRLKAAAGIVSSNVPSGSVS